MPASSPQRVRLLFSMYRGGCALCVRPPAPHLRPLLLLRRLRPATAFAVVAAVAAPFVVVVASVVFAAVALRLRCRRALQPASYAAVAFWRVAAVAAAAALPLLPVATAVIAIARPTTRCRASRRALATAVDALAAHSVSMPGVVSRRRSSPTSPPRSPLVVVASLPPLLVTPPPVAPSTAVPSPSARSARRVGGPRWRAGGPPSRSSSRARTLLPPIYLPHACVPGCCCPIRPCAYCP